METDETVAVAATLVETSTAQPQSISADRFGPFLVESVLGEGGMGVVYCGVHQDTGQAVAIKTLQCATSDALNALRREIHALSRVDHPRIVRIADHGLQDSVPWYAMQLLKGRSLRDCINAVWPPLDPGRDASVPLEATTPLLLLIADLCAPLASLHEAGIVHRDLKPGNVVLDDGNRPVLVDLGLALSFAGTTNREALLVDGSIAGTPSYMAPEQVRGELVDARTDLYALGCMLFECLAGQPPFHERSVSAILNAHLHRPPPLLSSLRPGVPAELDALLLKLLQKRPADRIGYADDVARTLRSCLNISGAEAISVRTQPSYLYRAELCGRGSLLQQIEQNLNEHQDLPPIVLLSGESGSGKTRLALEIALRAEQQRILVASGRCDVLGTSASVAQHTTEPLAPLRPLLTLAADRTRQGSAVIDTTLYRHGPVLAPYCDDIAQLPPVSEQPPPAPLPIDAARARLLVALDAVVAALSQQTTLLILLDDLQWADALTLSWLAHRAGGAARAGERAAILGTYRAEEVPPVLAQLERLASVTHHHLDHLDANSVARMAAGMLALRTIPAEVEAALVRGSDGNPFFVAEYLHAAITDGALRRDATGRWRFQPRHDYDALPLSSGLSALIERRLARLPPEAARLLDSASVLGRSMSTSLLSSTAQLDENATLDGFDMLRRRHILEHHEGQLRFTHDRMREAIYQRLEDNRRRTLHRQAAEALSHETGLRPVSQLAFHYARAGMPEPAYEHYLKAAELAQAAYDNERAISMLQAALEQAAALAPQRPLVPPRHHVRQQLGQRLTAAGRQEQARAAYQQAVALLPQNQHQQHAALQRDIGKSWELVHAHTQALAAYDRAAQHLDAHPLKGASERSAAWWHHWIQLHIERISIHYFRGDTQALQRTVALLQPELDRHGTEQQRARFYQSLLQRNLREERYRSSAETVAYARACLAASHECDSALELATAHFALGFVLCCHDALDEAGDHMSAALSGAERIGHLPLQARCIAYATMILRRLRDREAIRDYASRGRDIAKRSGMRDYIGVADANLGWVAWCEGHDAQASEHCAQALAHWQQLPMAYPFQWMARMPLLVIALQQGQRSEARAHAAAALQPDQQRLPDELELLLRNVADTSSGPFAVSTMRLLDSARRHGLL